LGNSIIGICVFADPLMMVLLFLISLDSHWLLSSFSLLSLEEAAPF